jgi:predicted neuraminidase
MTHLALALLLFAPGYDMLSPDQLTVEKVIGREFPGDYKHPASFDVLDNGDIYLAYYGGGGEYEDDSCVWGMRKAAGSETWTTPVVIADTPFRAEGNPLIWQAPDGVVWLFYVQSYGETWSDSRIKGKISKDQGATWSDSFMVAFEQGMMVRNHPVVMDDGRYLLPVYRETGHDRDVVGSDTVSILLHYNPENHTWTPSAPIVSPQGNLQAAVVRLDGDHLIAYCRRGGGYEPCDDCYAIFSESRDGGKTWSPGVNSEFPNPNSAVDFIKLASGNLLFVYNDNMNERTPLTVAISTDGGKTFPHRKNVGEGENTFAYPVLRQAKDGTIHLVYTTDERATVMHATFREASILE